MTPLPRFVFSTIKRRDASRETRSTSRWTPAVTTRLSLFPVLVVKLSHAS